MAVAFPTGYPLRRETGFEYDLGVETDYMQDGSPRSRIFGNGEWTNIPCVVGWISLADRDALLAFFRANRGEDTTWTIDGVDYIGKIVGRVSQQMRGNTFMLRFTYHAKENV